MSPRRAGPRSSLDCDPGTLMVTPFGVMVVVRESGRAWWVRAYLEYPTLRRLTSVHVFDPVLFRTRLGRVPTASTAEGVIRRAVEAGIARLEADRPGCTGLSATGPTKPAENDQTPY